MKKLHNIRHPAGLERRILRALPRLLLAGILIPVFMSLFVRVLPFAGSADEAARHANLIDIFAIALGITSLTAVFTLAIGCVIVVLMKGPGYVADGYELDDADKPDTDSKKDT